MELLPCGGAYTWILGDLQSHEEMYAKDIQYESSMERHGRNIQYESHKERYMIGVKCKSNMERHGRNIPYKSHGQRYANGVNCKSNMERYGRNIQYKSHKEKYTNDAKYKSNIENYYGHLIVFMDDGIKLSTYGTFVTTASGDMVSDVGHSLQCEFLKFDYVENMEYKYYGSKSKMNVDPTHDNQGTVSKLSRSELKRVTE